MLLSLVIRHNIMPQQVINITSTYPDGINFHKRAETGEYHGGDTAISNGG